MRRLALFVSILLGCSGTTTTETTDAGTAAPLMREPSLDVLARFPAFADHLGKGGALVRNGDVFTVERFAKANGRRPLRATLPTRAHGFTRLEAGGVAIDVRAEVEDEPLAAIEGAAVGHELSIVAEEGRVEEIRVLRRFAPEHVARWTLRTDARVRLVDGVVEVLDEDSRPRLGAQPMFAVDARGVRREPTLELVHEGATWTLTARLDTTGMTAPIALDPAWSLLEPMVQPRRLHTATLLTDGRVLVVGGLTGSETTSRAIAATEVYDPTTNAWTASGTLSEGRLGHTATRLSDGKVIVIGGTMNGGSAATASTEIFDPKTNTWSAGPPLPGARVHHGAALLSDGTVLVAGGLSRDSETTVDAPLPTLILDPVSRTFKSISTPNVAANPIVVPSDKKVFFIGGLMPDCTSGCLLKQFPVVTVYEESTGTFRNVAKLRRPRQSKLQQSLVAASLFGDGKQIMVVGGGDDSGELLDIAAGTSALGGELADVWSAPKMERLPSGDVIAIGGFVPTTPGGDVPLKLFPAPLVRHAKTLKWVFATSPTRRRWDHTTTVLGDGSVLIAGGQNKDGVMGTAELFKPLGLGQKCTESGDCASAFCVDGVCCDTSCSGQCEACSSSGKCLPVTGAPRGLRPLCDNPGTDVCMAKVCDGKTTDQCVLPNGSGCSDAVCNVSSFTAAGACDGKGACIKPANKDCAPFGCSETGCRTSCAGPSDCANGAICAAGRCIAGSGGACNDELSASIGTDGNPTQCHPYRCVQATGKCADGCVRSDDCAGGFVCGGSGKCEQPVVATDEGGGCATGRSPGSSLGLFALALAALGLSRRSLR